MRYCSWRLLSVVLWTLDTATAVIIVNIFDHEYVFAFWVVKPRNEETFGKFNYHKFINVVYLHIFWNNNGENLIRN